MNRNTKVPETSIAVFLWRPGTARTTPAMQDQMTVSPTRELGVCYSTRITAALAGSGYAQ
jgi:hypothetical protein